MKEPSADNLQERNLDDMTQIAIRSDITAEQDTVSSKIYLNVELMWDILQFNGAANSPELPTGGLLGQSLTPANDHSKSKESSILEVIVATSPDIVVDTADGGQGRPMLSFRTPVPSGSDPSRSTLPDDTFAESNADSLTLNTTPWLWADSLQSVNVYNSAYPHLSGGNAESMAWWDIGNSINAITNHI